MGLLKNIGNWIWNGVKSVAGSFGLGTSGFENDEAQNWQANQADLGRQWQELMLQKQFDYQTDMWNKTNQYNRPINQANRIREFGGNPYLLMSGSNSGVAQYGGTPTGMSAPSAGSGHSGTSYTPAGQFLANISAAKQSAANARLTNSEALFNEVNAALLQQKLMHEVDRLSKGNKLIASYADKWFDSTLKQMNQQTNALHAQEQLDLMNTVYRAIESVNLPDVIKSKLTYELANTDLIKRMQTTEGYKQWQIMQDVLESTAREEGLRLDNQTARETAKDIIEMLKEQNWWYDFNQLTSGIGHIFSAAGSLAGGFGMGRLMMPKVTTIKGFGR